MQSAAPSIELARGTVFADRYRIDGLLGRGGMGAVYRASDLYLAEDIALKLLLVELEQNPSLALRFRQEVKLSRRVNHSNIIRVHDIGEHGGLLYMTMELISGQTLRALINSRKEGMPQEQALWIGRSIAEGLRSAHAASIIHRDIKPSNVLIEESGRVVLTDFGIARCLDEDLGLTHGLLGTMSYMAPEQATNGAVDARTDIYALGLVILEMLLGERPSGTPAEILSRLDRTGEPVSPALARVLLRCLSLDPAGRPSGVAEIIDAIAAASITPHDETESAPTVMQATMAPKSLTRTTPAEPAQSKLAVLPFRYRGPREQDHLGDVLTDELVDELSRTRGLFVLGTGATARFRDERDPITVGKELRVSAVIDGAVQTGGDRIKVSVRLLDAENGVQRWVQQREGSLSDVFTFQESVVRRVVEELRLELHTMAHSRTAPTVALDRYVEARREMRFPDFTASSRALDLLDGALKLSPTFAPAIAAHAVASVRSWYLYAGDDERDWEAIASESVARAITEAPDIAETHLAMATLAAQRGEYRQAAAALTHTLQIAPTCAAAHEYLGFLQIEAGHLQKGLERLKLTVELDPSRVACWGVMARVYALLGDRAGFEATLATLEPMERPDHFSFVLVDRLRDAAWRRAHGELRELLAKADRLESTPTGRLALLYTRGLLGEIPMPELMARFAKAIEKATSPRTRSLSYQIATEALAGLDHFDEALQHLSRAASTVLVDAGWLERCPLLSDLHGTPEFIEAQRQVRARASAIWAP